MEEKAGQHRTIIHCYTGKAIQSVYTQIRQQYHPSHWERRFSIKLDINEAFPKVLLNTSMPEKQAEGDPGHVERKTRWETPLWWMQPHLLLKKKIKYEWQNQRHASTDKQQIQSTLWTLQTNPFLLRTLRRSGARMLYLTPSADFILEYMRDHTVNIRAIITQSCETEHNTALLISNGDEDVWYYQWFSGTIRKCLRAPVDLCGII